MIPGRYLPPSLTQFAPYTRFVSFSPHSYPQGLSTDFGLWISAPQPVAACGYFSRGVVGYVSPVSLRRRPCPQHGADIRYQDTQVRLGRGISGHTGPKWGGAGGRYRGLTVGLPWPGLGGFAASGRSPPSRVGRPAA